MSEHAHRRLAAIVSIDVAGYSRLMGDDEIGTLAALKAHRNAIDPLVFNHGGHIVKTTGDGALIEFPSAVSALQSMREIQRVMAERNESLGDDRRMQFRVGLHVGEIIQDGDDIFGDSVNIAARLQEAAEPGGIWLSGEAAAAIGNKTDAVLSALGQRSFKNIAAPVNVHCIDETALALRAQPMAGSVVPVRKAVAVLPFANMSGDQEQEYFVDGITEDIITALSLRSGIKVIARNSSFVYKGHSKDVKAIGKELDAGYVLEGSVRKSGNRVRITAQLIDTSNGQHMWAERYDRELADIFDLQDEITGNISARVAPEIWRNEEARAAVARPEDLDAWDLYLRALSHYHAHTADDMRHAQGLLQRSIEKDPNFAASHSLLALTLTTSAHENWDGPTAKLFSEALEYCGRAIRLGDPDGIAHATSAVIYGLSGRHEQGVEAGRQAVARNPYAPISHAWYATALMMDDQLELATEHHLKAYELSHNDVHRFHVCRGLAYTQFFMGQYDAALSWADKSEASLSTHVQILTIKAATLACLDRLDEARDYVRRFLAEMPGMNQDKFRRGLHFKNAEHGESFLGALVRAGLPE